MKFEAKKIDKINLDTLGEYVIEAEYRNYFLSKAGVEHYKLLAYIGNKINNSNLIDIGTYKGCSALALSYNKNNKVYSFDIAEGNRKLSTEPSNIKFIVDDLLKEKYEKILLSSQFILLDTFHDGIFENKFLNHLNKINWKGDVILDDIYLNEEMKSLWKNINLPKTDLTRVGHWSGTGLVKF